MVIETTALNGMMLLLRCMLPSRWQYDQQVIGAMMVNTLNMRLCEEVRKSQLLLRVKYVIQPLSTPTNDESLLPLTF